VVEEGGTVDKFIGDAVMASFGVPVAQSDAALRAVRAGLGMLERLAAWNVERARAGEPPIEIGIGVHSGDVVAGNIGSTKKMEYTVIGDTVNTSSRIEQLNKRLGTRLLVSAQTHTQVADAVEARALEPVMVAGKSRPVLVYEVTGLRRAGGLRGAGG
jgi:adenylate cyclase